MRAKQPLVPQKRRRIPPQFSWIDHRLIRDGHLQGQSAHALALYLFLVTVADADGLSWYSDATLCRHLDWEDASLEHARQELVQTGLVAYHKPLYQVLDLAPAEPPPAPRRGEAVAIGDVLANLLGGAR